MLSQLLKDKNGQYNLRDVSTLLFVLVVIVSWAGQQFYKYAVPDYMFYTISGMAVVGILLQTLEKTTPVKPLEEQAKTKKDEN